MHQFSWISRKALLPAPQLLGGACKALVVSQQRFLAAVLLGTDKTGGSSAAAQVSAGSQRQQHCSSLAGRGRGKGNCSAPAFPVREAGLQLVTWSLEVDAPHFHRVLRVVRGDLSVVQEAFRPWL